MEIEANSAQTGSDMFELAERYMGSTPATSAILSSNPERYREEISGPNRMSTLESSPGRRHRRGSFSIGSRDHDINSSFGDPPDSMHAPEQSMRVSSRAMTISENLDSGSRSPSPCPSILSVTSSTCPGVLRCEQDNCDAMFTGEYRKGNRQRHIRLKHGTMKQYPCEAGGCARVFRRQDARLKHYRKHHNDLAPAPIHRRK